MTSGECTISDSSCGVISSIGGEDLSALRYSLAHSPITRSGEGIRRSHRFTIGDITPPPTTTTTDASEAFADMGYDSNQTRLLVVEKLRAVPFISLQTRGVRGFTPEEKRVHAPRS